MKMISISLCRRVLFIGMLLSALSLGCSAGTNAPAASTNAAPVAAPVEKDKDTGKPIVTTPSGLKYVDLAVGTGPDVKQGDHVGVKYVGKLLDGTVFDASEKHPEMGPTFNYVQGVSQLISGWSEGTSTMKVGGKRKLIIPPQLGYGTAGVPDVIPANATLIFEIEMVVDSDATAPAAAKK